MAGVTGRRKHSPTGQLFEVLSSRCLWNNKWVCLTVIDLELRRESQYRCGESSPKVMKAGGVRRRRREGPVRQGHFIPALRGVDRRGLQCDQSRGREREGGREIEREEGEGEKEGGEGGEGGRRGRGREEGGRRRKGGRETHYRLQGRRKCSLF